MITDSLTSEPVSPSRNPKATLEPGGLSVDAEPGSGLALFLALEEGTYTVTGECDGYTKASIDVALVGGEIETATLELDAAGGAAEGSGEVRCMRWFD